MLEVEGVS